MNTSTDNAAMDVAARRPARRHRRREPGPFPVTIVRPASISLAPLSAVQRERRQAASQLAAELTDAAVHGRRMYSTEPLFFGVNQTARVIIRDAPGIAADPPPGGVQVGEDAYGLAAAVALHAGTWSLVIDATRFRAYGWCPPVSHAFTDRPDLLEDMGIGYLDACFDTDCSVAGVEWSDMVAQALALTAGPRRRP